MCWEVLCLVNPACPRGRLREGCWRAVPLHHSRYNGDNTDLGVRVPPSNEGLGTLTGCPGASHFASLLLSSSSINGNKFYFTGLIQSSGSQSLVPRPAAAATCTPELVR